MPGIARLGDICTGHGCWPPRPPKSGSPNVFVNHKPWIRQGDPWKSHCCLCCKNHPCHTSKLCAGSETIFINSKAGGRIGDPVCCGSAVARSSTNVFGG